MNLSLFYSAALHFAAFLLVFAFMQGAPSKKTKAVMIAHTLGNPFDLKAVTEFCRKRRN